MSEEKKDFKKGDFVKYVPYHAHGDLNHKDCEDGIVTSLNDSTVFVRFGTDKHSQGCYRNQLRHRQPPKAKD